MKVIKLGGSLSYTGQLPVCLAQAAKTRQRLVLVPGGGAFANQVRMAQHDWRFNDDIAHSMAILSMQQMALLFKGLEERLAIAGSLPQIEAEMAQGHQVIWSPNRSELDAAGIPASWDVSSDSLAAWLAKTLQADELILVKAASIDTGMSLDQMADDGIIDPAFCGIVHDAAFKTTVINADHFGFNEGLADA